MKKALRIMMALLFFAGMANAQTVFDFEDGTFPTSWTTSSPYPWAVQNVIMSGSNYLIQSGNAGHHNSISSVEFSLTFGEPGYITFDAKCMGEGDYNLYDECVFSIDGEIVFRHGADLEGWGTYGFNVGAGTHIFKWSYEKDGSTHPEGDYFQVDNITYGPGSACVAPTHIEGYTVGSKIYVAWNGTADSYTLRYKKGTGSWTTVSGLTDNEYVIENLSSGEYKVSVQSDCIPGQWVETDYFLIHNPVSAADWYGFSYSAYDPDKNYKFVTFMMQDLVTVNAASEQFDYVYDATFVNGEAWFLMDNTETGVVSLYKAPININEKTIGTPEVVVGEIYSDKLAYNPANGLIYFIDNSDQNLKSLDPSNPGPITSYGVVDNIYGLAINKTGQAYVCRFNGETGENELATLNLTTTSMTTVAVLDVSFYNMAFDMLTGELFTLLNSQVYYIDHSTGEYCYLGDLGGDEYVEINGLFMTYDWDVVGESNVESLNVYPNPTQGQFTVEGTGSMVITNLLGQEILRQEIEEKATVELPAGMYIVRLNNAISKVVVE